MIVSWEVSLSMQGDSEICLYTVHFGTDRSNVIDGKTRNNN